MPLLRRLRDYRALAVETARAVLLITLPAVFTGSACAFFLWSLREVTALHWRHPALLFGLPVIGLMIAALYRKVGSTSEGGNSLLIEQIHRPDGGVPRRMAPLILVTTLLTHLGGGSAGREGTAVQMGGSIASAFARVYRRLGFIPRRTSGNPATELDEQLNSASDLRLLLMAGIAAGFGGVFGTPLAGAVFAIEVLTIGRLSYEFLFPCLIAALLGDWSCSVWGVEHTHYEVAPLPEHGDHALLDWLLVSKVGIAAIGFGLTSSLFAKLTHGITAFSRRLLPNSLLRPVMGGLLIIALTYVLGTRDYLGLGVDAPGQGHVTILSCFQAGGAESASWWWKLLFTSITLGFGFKGGEVTPLFFIGAALGNTLAGVLNAPVDLMAAVGFVALFAGATNTPLASTIMAIELFGSEHTPYYALGCCIAFLASGHSGIYSSQRIGQPKGSHWNDHSDKTLSELTHTD